MPRKTNEGRDYGREPDTQATMRLKCMDQLATDTLPYMVLYKQLAYRAQTYDEAIAVMQELSAEDGPEPRLFLEIRPLNKVYDNHAFKYYPGYRRKQDG